MPFLSIDFNDFRLLHPEVIELELECFAQAAQISNRGLNERYQWQSYINALALLGFTQWLREHDAALVVDKESCSLFQPQYATVIEAVCNLRVGKFRLCLVASEHLLDEVVSIPGAVLDVPEFAAHFYVALEVQEEQGHVIIRGHSRYDQLARYQQLANVSADDRWRYELPSSLLDPEPNHLLFNLNLLEPTAIPLPKAIAHPSPTSITQTELETILIHLQSTEHSLWQVLPWEKGVSLLQSPELLDLLHQWQRSTDRPASLRIRISQVFALVTQRAVNAAKWLQGELDELAQSLGWYPSEQLKTAAFEFRSVDQFRTAIQELRYQGMDIPSEPNPICQDIDWGEVPLRLCATTWASDATAPDPQWTLLLILGTQMGGPLPNGLKFCIADLTGLLVEETSDLDSKLLYARANAQQSQKLVATIVSPEGQALTLCPYSFEATPIE